MSRNGWNPWNGWFNGHNVNSTGYTNNTYTINSLSVRPAHYNLCDNMVKAIFWER